MTGYKIGEEDSYGVKLTKTLVKVFCVAFFVVLFLCFMVIPCVNTIALTTAIPGR